MIFLLIAISLQSFSNNSTSVKTASAESVLEFAAGMDSLDKEVLKAEIDKLTFSERKRLVEICMAEAKHAQEIGADVPMPVLYVLAIIIPPLAVGIYTDWDTPTLWNLLFTIIGWVPGVIHAFIVLTR